MSAPAAKIRRPPQSTTAPGGSWCNDIGDLVELVQHRRRQGVGLGPVEPDERDAVGPALQGDERLSHGRTVPEPAPGGDRPGSVPSWLQQPVRGVVGVELAGR